MSVVPMRVFARHSHLRWLLLCLLPVAALAATYEYDELGRLKRVVRDDGSEINYAFDPAGNRTNMSSLASAGRLQFSASAYSVAETGGSVTITLSRTGGSNGAISASYATANGTASAGSDYTAASGTLNWANGDVANKTFSIPVLDDGNYEGNETINLSLTGSTLGSPTTAVVTIVENDAPQYGTLSLSPASYSTLEGTTTVTVTVVRASGSYGAVAVQYATSNGTATAGSDYTAASGTLNWASGDASPKSFPVAILDDGAGEASETVNLALSNATGNATIGTGNGTITIQDNEPGSLGMSSTGPTVNENAGPAIVTVIRTGGSYGAVSVTYSTANGSAVAGSDYTAVSGTVNWANGDANPKTFTVPLINDAVTESTETFSAQLSSPTGGATIFGSSSTITINDEDSGIPPTPTSFTVTPHLPTPAMGGNYAATWNASAGATRYELWEVLGNSKAYDGPSTSKSFSNMPSGWFDYRVKACNGLGCSAFSPVVHVQSCNPTCLDGLTEEPLTEESP